MYDWCGARQWLTVFSPFVIFATWFFVSLAFDEWIELGDNKHTVLTIISISLAGGSSILTLIFLVSSYMRLGQPDAGTEAPEGIFTMFGQVLNVMQSFGLMLSMAQYTSLPTDSPLFNNKFLHNNANAVLNSALVQSGVGLVDINPTTLAEKTVIWAAAYIGGVLVVQIFLVTVVFWRRAWFNVNDKKTNVTFQQMQTLMQMIQNQSEKNLAMSTANVAPAPSANAVTTPLLGNSAKGVVAQSGYAGDWSLNSVISNA